MAQYFKTFRKEFLEITHAADYEHPCQFNMQDVQVNVDDVDLNRNLKSTYGYEKTVVAFDTMHDFLDCNYLGEKNFQKSVE